jgi:hypothetical protein
MNCMKNFRYLAPGLLFLLLALASCNTQKQVIKEPIRAEGADFLFNKLKENQLKFDWMSAKFSAEYRNDRKKTSFGGQMRIRRDSLIWLSLSPMMGIEVMRLMISQDSIKYINRLNNTFFEGDYDYLNKFLNTNIDYDILQSFLIGNDLSFYEDGKFKADIDKGEYKLYTAGRQKLKKYVKNADEALKIFIENIWLNPQTFKITRADVKEMRREKIRLEAIYGNFINVSEQLFPSDVEYNIYAGNEIRVKASFSKVEINAVQPFPFKIPASYRPVNKSR